MIDFRVLKLSGWWRVRRYVAFAIDDFGEIKYVACGRTRDDAFDRAWALGSVELWAIKNNTTKGNSDGN